MGRDGWNRDARETSAVTACGAFHGFWTSSTVLVQCGYRYPAWKRLEVRSGGSLKLPFATKSLLVLV